MGTQVWGWLCCAAEDLGRKSSEFLVRKEEMGGQGSPPSESSTLGSEVSILYTYTPQPKKNMAPHCVLLCSSGESVSQGQAQMLPCSQVGGTGGHFRKESQMPQLPTYGRPGPTGIFVTRGDIPTGGSAYYATYDLVEGHPC